MRIANTKRSFVKLRHRDKRYKRVKKERERDTCGVEYWEWLLGFFTNR